MLFPDDNLYSTNENEFKRLAVKYVDTSERFNLQSELDYSKQFAHIYASRLREMRELLSEKAKQKWGNKYPLKSTGDLREDNPEKCILIGTLYKDQKLKPSILREICEEAQLAPQPIKENFTHESDKLILEDELQRVRLIGNMDPDYFVTGIVCAVLGYADADGKFLVDEYLFQESGPQTPLKDLTTSPLLVLISGLDQSSAQDFSMSLALFQQWIYGNLESFSKTLDFEAANIVRIIIAGNSVRASPEIRQKSLINRQPESMLTLKAVKSVDELIAGWSKSVNVDLMPGEFDPSNFMLPQQSMHHCMFPESAPCGAFKGVPNPYECKIEDRTILGTSGQNISNIQNYSKISDPLEALRSVITWGHLAPTSPDTLACYPYYDRDPFVLKTCPHILFAGNTSEYKTDMHTGSNGQKTRLVCIPSFAKTQCVAVVNIRSLECQKLCFRLNDIEE